MVKNRPAMREAWFDPCVRKIPWRREWLLTPVFWPGEVHGLHGLWCHKESDRTKQLSLHCDDKTNFHISYGSSFQTTKWLRT